MNDHTKKGPLIQKKQKTSTLSRPTPVIVTDNDAFKFTKEEPKAEIVIQVPIEEKEKNVVAPKIKAYITEPEKKKKVPLKRVSVVGKNNNVKSIKIPHDLHTQIGILGKFTDENKTYAIISQLVDYYVENELTDRQQRQFKSMNEFFQQDTKE
ncbi:MAG: hypothetical protein IMZ40_00155 [Bacilli bacterium]|nr:hypothetical protein [Bacilli bacterium]